MFFVKFSEKYLLCLLKCVIRKLTTFKRHRIKCCIPQNIKKNRILWKREGITWTLLSFCCLFGLPFLHLVISNFLSCNTAQFVDVHLMKLRQQILHPVVPDGTHRPDVDPRGHHHVVENDPVQLRLLLKQLTVPTPYDQSGCWGRRIYGVE